MKIFTELGRITHHYWHAFGTYYRKPINQAQFGGYIEEWDGEKWVRPKADINDIGRAA